MSNKLNKEDINLIAKYIDTKTDAEILNILNTKIEEQYYYNKANKEFIKCIKDIQNLMLNCDDKYNNFFIRRLVSNRYYTIDNLKEIKAVLNNISNNNFILINNDYSNCLEFERKYDSKILSKNEVENKIDQSLKQSGIKSEYLDLLQELKRSQNEFFIIDDKTKKIKSEYQNLNEVYEEILNKNYEEILLNSDNGFPFDFPLKIDLTNYNNFYKTESDKKELKKELYELANKQEWTYFYNLDENSDEFKQFLTIKNDDIWINDGLTIEQLMYFIEKTTDHNYGFWTFSKYNKKYQMMLNLPEFHTYKTSQYEKYNIDKVIAENFKIIYKDNKFYEYSISSKPKKQLAFEKAI
ncbi:hypothetical protein RRG52_02245 [Mycoplasmopsis cynos]|uniref:Mbov_0392 family ICE element protein n=1 Tax=Mycoplasmopsis cynos TaxID=171284 RepID=UPI002AFFC614|nr:hypothetical protein [Mycoplasmopsis cynos]WQQ13558.1 hypothetical protein RRG52_02245 [Mycoplasmopsis cynos]